MRGKKWYNEWTRRSWYKEIREDHALSGGVLMEKNVKIYREEFDHLPARFKRKIEHDLQYLLKAQIPGLKKVYLFGSCARGQVRSTSDVDLMIQTAGRVADRALTADIRWELDQEMDGVRTDVVYTYDNGEAMSRIFKKEVERDRKLIMEVME